MLDIQPKFKENLIEEEIGNNKLKVAKSFLSILKNNRLDDRLLFKLEQDCCLIAGEINLLYPSGIKGIICELSRIQDLQMLEAIKSSNTIGTTNRIIQSLQIRVSSLSPREAVTKIISYLMLPGNISLAIKLAFKTCHLIWKNANDVSTDFNFYSKRGILLAVYIKIIIFYLNDYSENNQATDEYIKNIVIQTVNKIKKLKSWMKLENIPFFRLWF